MGRTSKFIRFIGLIALLLTLNGAGSADAAVEVGSHCDANVIYVPGIEGTIFPLEAASPSDLPTSSPITGVATSWAVGSSDNSNQRLKVLRTFPGTGTVQAVAEAGPELVTQSRGPFPIRIPVLAGDRFGLNSPQGGALACSAGPGNVIGTTVRNPQLGESEPYFSDDGYQVAVSVTVEPDLDGDGYGDETQEPCPEAIDIQVPCPVVTFQQRAELKKRAILLYLNVSSQASAQAFGQVAWQVRAGDHRNHRLIVALNGGLTRTILPRRKATFRLPLSQPVIKRLGRLKPTQALRAKLTAEVTDLAGRVVRHRIRVRLPGRK